jgi:hypothetical protein
LFARFARKPNQEGGASARNRSRFDPPAAHAGDASDRRRPQSRAVGIRAQERTEDSRQIFFGDVPAIALDLDIHFPARPIFTVAFALSHDHSPHPYELLKSAFFRAIPLPAPQVGIAKGETVSNAIVISEWDADAFHRRVMDLELQGYVARRETYRVTPEMNPETGRIVHLHTVELYQADPDEAV